jgi:hypothetical protein
VTFVAVSYTGQATLSTVPKVICPVIRRGEHMPGVSCADGPGFALIFAMQYGKKSVRQAVHCA